MQRNIDWYSRLLIKKHIYLTQQIFEENTLADK